MLPFQDTTLPEETRVNDLLKRLSIEEKVHLCHQIASMQCSAIPRFDIAPLTMADGPKGFRLEDGQTASSLPCGTSLASTWDENAAERYGNVIGREGNALGRQVILGPGVNLMRTPLNGRNFEYFGEDPCLAGNIAAGYIRGCQKEKVAACPKHLALNNQEICRTTGDSRADERTIREIYTRAFQILCQKSSPWMMMSSYNKINGTYASENGFLQQTLAKDEFGFDGVMVSDWGGAHDTKKCALGGLDLNMGLDPQDNLSAQPLLDMVQSGEIPESVIDEKARRMIRLLIRTCMLNPEMRPEGEVSTERNHSEIRQLAEEGMVLLRNNGMLPLDQKKLKKLAVIGPAADFCHDIGSHYECGGSGAVHPPYEITPLQGIRELCGDQIQVLYHRGCGFFDACTLPAELVRIGNESGLKTEYFDTFESMKNGGSPFLVQNDTHFNYLWSNKELAGGMMIIRRDRLAVRWTGQLVPKYSGKADFCVHRTQGKVRCVLNGKVMFDEFEENSGWQSLRKLHAEFEATAGTPVDLLVEYETEQLLLGDSVRFLWQDAQTFDYSEVIDLAKEADAVVFVGGTTHDYDKEAIGWGDVLNADIPDLELPGSQAKLISALAEVNSNLAVVLVNGSVVSMEPWLNKTAAVLEAWYAGMEGGRAIANVLFGAEPGGRLPCTFAHKLNDYACHALDAYPGVRTGDSPYVEYKEKIFVGYRYFDKEDITPAFPFGFGLSYTQFECALTAFNILDDTASSPRIKISCRVKNTGDRKGAQVVQLYVSDLDSSEPRPVRELRGFGKVWLEPGENKTLEFCLSGEDFAFWSEKARQWLVEPGEFSILLGTSSRTFFASENITLKA